MTTRSKAFFLRHHDFLLLFILFFVFRLLAILLLRPGGFFADASDYDFYAVWGELGAMGYRTFDNLWTAYPPLFPILMLPIFELSSRIPPWVEPRLFFHILFGLELLLFECGNVILIYRLALKLAGADGRLHTADTQPADGRVKASAFWGSPLGIAALYALLFAPVYTLLGWFEAMPLFFLLWGLDLLLGGWRWGWVASAVAAALGFLTKLTPMLLVPVAVRWLGARLSWSALQSEWFNPRALGNLLRPALYGGVFLATVVGAGYWLVGGQMELALSSLRVNSIRPPWQSIWAVLDGYYGFGLVPVDMRNLIGLERSHWQSSLPWPWITAGFGLLYLWLYTRPYDWSQRRTPVAFTAVSVIWLFLYSKGWSPQFLVWVLAFVVLLMPTLRGVVLACALSLVNVVESYLFLLLLPGETWLLVGTVVVRTLLLVLLAVEFLAQIWPSRVAGVRLQRLAARLAWLVVGVALVGGLIGAPRAAAAYQANRLAAHPCRAAIAYLQEQASDPPSLLISDQIEVWRDFYPWLADQYALRVIDGYNPQDRPWAEVVAERLNEVVDGEAFWWIERPEPPSQAGLYFADPAVHVLEQQTFGSCSLRRVIRLADAPLALATVAGGGEVRLLRADLGQPQVGADLQVVLYWQAASSIEARYTVFTQLLNAAGQVVAQQDNPPVGGAAPTDGWLPGAVIRDPYRLALPAALPAGDYQLIVGLYNPDGRVQWRLPGGEQADHVEFAVRIEEKAVLTLAGCPLCTVNRL